MLFFHKKQLISQKSLLYLPIKAITFTSKNEYSFGKQSAYRVIFKHDNEKA